MADGLLQEIQIDKLLYMKWYKVFNLVALIYCWVYMSNDVTRGYIHFVFIIFVLESMLIQVVQVIQIVLLLVVFLLVGFADAVMYDGALI